MNISSGKKSGTYQIPISSRVSLEGNLSIPEQPRGMVLFVHGSGSSRFSPRNQYVARVLQEARFATLLIDLLTKQEEEQDLYTGHLRFNIDLLSERVVEVTNWLTSQLGIKDLKIGYFGASTGAAAALVAAARLPLIVRAVVSRGGRPDLASAFLPRVKAPTLLIVGSRDTQVIQLNQTALSLLQAEKRLVLIEGATHLFEEPGALEQVARIACEWFEQYLPT
ncbi:MAG TPA: dienelactone hydrolase family protein [Ktedonobacteraceae bacterium]|jgi:pimeloyl-ACP methyl ester carboxylesterase|nr:dienelactone hydrolase family protein [Ktedonobacteraceae bacterium]